MKRRTPLRKVSEKRKKLDEEYFAKRAIFLQLNPNCAICGEMATDVHHKARRGKNYLNVLHFLPTCRNCHQKVHDNPQWARENGYLI